jgi:nickel-dependent lactate racemase
VTMVQLPYGSELVEMDLKADVLDVEGGGDTSGEEPDAGALLRQAVRNPLGTKRLRDLIPSKPDASIVVVVDDHTRAAPTELMLDALIEELGEARADRITTLVACGTHEQPPESDLKRMLGHHYGRVPVAIHDCDASDLEFLGTTTRGTPIWVNPTYLHADVKILTGDITLHYYAGFGGGRKSILPGIAGRETIKRNHALLVDPHARTAHLHQNPVHLDMVEAATFAHPDFALNCLSAPSGTMVAVYAGAVTPVFAAGVARAQQLLCRRSRAKYDLLVVSAGGFPKDRNLYQAAKAIENCYHAVVPGGLFILVAECRDGIGDPIFESWMDRYPTFTAVAEAIQSDFVLGGHKAFYLRRVMQQLNLSIVSSLESNQLTRWQIPAYQRLDEALAAAPCKPQASVGIVQNGFDTFFEPA